MFDIELESSSRGRWFFSFDAKKKRLVPCQVWEMRAGRSYYMIEPHKSDKLVFGTFRTISPEEYERSFPTCPSLKSKGYGSLDLFITAMGCSSLTDASTEPSSLYKIISLSTSTDDYGSGCFDEKQIREEECRLLSPEWPLCPDYFNQTPNLLRRPPNELTLASMFKDIQLARENMEIDALLGRYHDNMRTKEQLDRWSKFRSLHAKSKSGDEKIRKLLLCCVAVNQGDDPSQVFINSLLAYKKERAARKEEYYTFWASCFGSKNSRSRTAKLIAVDTMVADLSRGQFSFDRVPEAAKNGDLKNLLSCFKQAQAIQGFSLVGLKYRAA